MYRIAQLILSAAFLVLVVLETVFHAATGRIASFAAAMIYLAFIAGASAMLVFAFRDFRDFSDDTD